ncbi:zinc finger and BTB domain-containing protein 42 isoform X1 [Lissotriton helveticus]
MKEQPRSPGGCEPPWAPRAHSPSTWHEEGMEFPEHGRRLLQCLSQQRLQGFLCDCTVLVGEARFRAHRAVLASCSMYFHLFYREQPGTAARDTVHLNSDIVTAAAFGLLLQFMYEGRLELGRLPAEDVLAAASYLHMYDVVKVCKGRMKDREGRLGADSPYTARHEGDPGDRKKASVAPVYPEKVSWTSEPGDVRAVSPEVAPGPETAGRIQGSEVCQERQLSEGPPGQTLVSEVDCVLDLSFKPVSERDLFNPSRGHGQLAPDAHHQAIEPLVKNERDMLTDDEEGGVRSPEVQHLGTNASSLITGLGHMFAGNGLPHVREEDMDHDRQDSEDDLDCSDLSSAVLVPPGHICVCPLCSKVFPSPHILQLHLSSHFRDRDGTRPKLSPDGAVPTCTICGKTFSCMYTLKRHERTHSGEKPYTCVQCGKSFQYSHNLSRHAVVHTREKPHGCKWCERRFTQSGDLYRHIRKFHCGLVKSLAME